MLSEKRVVLSFDLKLRETVGNNGKRQTYSRNLILTVSGPASVAEYRVCYRRRSQT